MEQKIIGAPIAYPGCDFVVELGKERQGTPIKLLQLTDMQMTDRTGYDFAKTVNADESETTSLKSRGRNDIRVE